MAFKPYGSFTAVDAPLSRVDARVKIVLLLAWTIVVFVAPGPLVVACGAVLLVACQRLARIEPASIIAAARPVSVILAFTLLANLVSCDGTAPVALGAHAGLDPEGGLRGLFAVLRIVMLLGLSLAVSATTTPPQISDACVRLLRPLGRLGVPVGDIGSVLSIALRFVPIVSEEFERTRLAQRARGVRFDEGGVVVRLRRWGAVFTPLIIGLFRRADRLADSMAARCYADGAGVRVEPEPLCPRDRAILWSGLAAMVFVVALGM